MEISFQRDYIIRIHAEERFPRDLDIAFSFFERNVLMIVVEFKKLHFKEHTGNNAGNRMKKSRRFSSIVKTQCLWRTLLSLKDMDVVRSIEYLLPQVGWGRNGCGRKKERT